MDDVTDFYVTLFIGVLIGIYLSACVASIVYVRWIDARYRSDATPEPPK